jgi:hypothetical protein
MRLLGRRQVPGCCPGTRAGGKPGPDCSGGGSMGTRAAKRAEARLVEAQIAQERGCTDSEGQRWYHRPWEGWEPDDYTPPYLAP